MITNRRSMTVSMFLYRYVRIKFNGQGMVEIPVDIILSIDMPCQEI